MKQLTVITTALLLTTIAISFALWADVLKIQLVAYTGNVDVQFGSWSVREYVGFPDGSGGWRFVEEGSDPEAKDVGQCKVTLQEVKNEESGSPSTAGNNDLDLVITITDGYPGYKCEVTFEVKNTGSIPVKLYFFDEHGNRLKLLATFTIGNNAVMCTLDGEDGAQVHPDESKRYTLSCLVRQSAEENAQYTAQIYIQARQWNEPLS
jgi:catechol 2,3-dioxygenase-like lactoylglutathione lyase family enzyme